MALFNFTGNKQAIIKGDNLKKITLIDVSLLTRPKTQNLDNYHIGVSFQLEAVRLSYNLPSLRKAKFPDIKFADNLATKMAKIADVQADYPSIYANIYHQKAGFNKTNLIASVPIQNKGIIGYADLLKPYLTTGDVKLLGEDDKILLEVDRDDQILNTDDWLQIEVDYVCVVSGIEKPKEINKFTTGELLERGFIVTRNGITTVEHNNAALPYYAQVINDLKSNTIHLAGGSVTNLKGLLAAKDLIDVIFLNNCDLITNSTLESDIKLFTKLKQFRSLSTPRHNVDWPSVIIEVPELKELLLESGSGLTTAHADEICITFDTTGRTYGLLDLSGNNGVSVTSETARNNLTTKGWTLTF